MRLLLSLALAGLITGCSTTVPVTAKFPQVPELITKPCPDLKKIDPATATLSEISKTITNNYTLYYECAVKVDAFSKWHQEQKAIFESVK